MNRHIFLATVLVACSLVTQRANAVPLSSSYAVNFSGHVQLWSSTYLTSPVDWITIISVGVKATYYPHNQSPVYDTWFDLPVPQGAIALWGVYERFSQWGSPGGLYSIAGQHRYVAEGIPHTLPPTSATTWVPYQN
jgi:hypothetical protein